MLRRHNGRSRIHTGSEEMVRLFDVVLNLGENESLLVRRAAELLGVPVEHVRVERLVRKSLDARRNRPPRFVCVLDVSLPDEERVIERVGGKLKLKPMNESTPPPIVRRSPAPEKRPVVVGSGPAGLFASLTLASRGIPVILLERGRSLQQRIADTASFWERGILDPESNVHFGEGGAGTFSDGKLTTRLRDSKIDMVKRVLVDFGAPPEILTDGKPHVGTDRLRQVVTEFRRELVRLGCEVRFGAKVSDIIVRRGEIAGVVVNESEEIRTGHLVLAIGQSAADTYRMLMERGVRLEAKPFAMGLRVEHPQELINRIQYGRWWSHPELPPADYFLAVNVPGLNRSVYTFCMCPGGRIIGCSSEKGGVVTNGMSLYSRNSPFANSAVVVNVRTEDFAGPSPLNGVFFRRQWEEKAFVLGGRDYRAPAQRLTDFVYDKESRDVGPTSFRPGVVVAPLREVLPSFVCEALRKGLVLFEQKMPGFLTSEAVLVGVETRTSSPVRILRGEDGQSIAVRGVYPCGEGAGYAGGIVSSAVDGMKAAERIVGSLS